MENILNINKKHYVKGFVKSAFTDFKNNWKKLVLMMFIIFAVSYSYDFVVNSQILFIAQQIISSFISISFLVVMLNIVDGKDISIKQIFTGINLKQFVFIILASLVMALFVVVGLILLIVPGIIFAIALSLSAYSILDKNKGIISSLKYSWTITKGYRFKMFILWIIGILLSFIGLITFGVGMLVVIPVIYLMQARLYRELSKECDMCKDGTCTNHKEIKEELDKVEEKDIIEEESNKDSE